MSMIVPRDRETPRPASAIVRGATLIKDMGRLRHIVGVAARHGFGEALERLNLQDNAIVAILARRDPDPSPARTMPERLRRALQELGPTFVKLGQVLSTRPDLVPAEYVDQLKHLQEDVAPAPFAEMRATVEGALGRRLEEVFASFDETPVAAASVAQVYRARLFDGEDVAVKVLRPGVRDVVDADIGVMHFLARRLEATFAEARALNLGAMVRALERALKRELDLRSEARNLERFGRMFAGRGDVRVPRVIPEWTSRDVLVMEFVPGERITDAAERLSPARREALVAACFDVLYTMVLRQGLFHGDLHPGNVKLAADGAIVLYDFGLVGRLTPAMRERVVDLLVAVGQRDAQAVAEAFHEMAERARPVAMNELVAEIADLLDHAFSERTLSELDLGALLVQVSEIGVRFGLRVPAEYTMMIKAVLTLEGVGKALAPEVDPVAAARPYVMEVLRSRYDPDRLAAEAGRAVLGVSRLARELPPTLRELLRSVEGGRVRLGVDLATSPGLAPALRGALGPVTDAVLAGGFVVAGALAMGHGAAQVAGLPAVSIVLLVLGVVFAVRALVSRRG
jgi:ubiquinone biosynthesis protein